MKRTLTVEELRRRITPSSNGHAKTTNKNNPNHEYAGEPEPEIQARPPAEWPDPVSLESDTVPNFPLAELPGPLAAWAEAEAHARQVPLDLPAMVVLGFAGAAIAGKFEVAPRDGWREPTNAFVEVTLPPGERKTAVFGHALEPIQCYEADEMEKAVPRIAEAASQHRVLEAKLKLAELAAAKAKGTDEEKQLSEQRRELARELKEHIVPEEPQAHCDDVTPEMLAKLLARQGGRLLQASAEGTLFEIAKGRYSEHANFDVYLKGHAGDPLRVQRVSREADIVEHPALSIVVAVQPDVIAGLAGQASMRGRGFLARWWYSVPQGRVGSRLIATTPVPAIVTHRYHETMLSLWRLSAARDAKGNPTPHVLCFSPAADRALQEFERWLEPRLAEGEELAHLAGWANKLAGAIVRIAGILHVAAPVGDGKHPTLTIGTATVETAIRLGRDYLLPHAISAFGLMGADETRSAARSVWVSIVRNSESAEYSETAPPHSEPARYPPT